jgi:hypothetical protein
MRVSSADDSVGFSSLPGEPRRGFHSRSAISMAWEVLSSSVRRTVALLVSPAAIAASRETLNDSRCERRWMMGQRSVERPRRVSTSLRGELVPVKSNVGGVGNGVDVGCEVLFGGVPSDSAAITS